MCFQEKPSTIDHLVRLKTFIRDAFVNKEHAVSIFVEKNIFLEKASDTTYAWKYGILRDLYMYNVGLKGHLQILSKTF